MPFPISPHPSAGAWESIYVFCFFSLLEVLQCTCVRCLCDRPGWWQDCLCVIYMHEVGTSVCLFAMRRQSYLNVSINIWTMSVDACLSCYRTVHLAVLRGHASTPARWPWCLRLLLGTVIQVSNSAIEFVLTKAWSDFRLVVRFQISGQNSN